MSRRLCIRIRNSISTLPKSRTMCRVSFIFLIYCFLTSYIQAQEIIRNVKLKKEVNLEYRSAFDNELNSNKTVSRNTQILKNETMVKNATMGNKEIFDNEKHLKNSTQNVILTGAEILENEKKSTNNEFTKLKLDGRIVNGSKTYLGQFPHQVSLRTTGGKYHFCGGSIINLKFILTAAHCMFVGIFIPIKREPRAITVVAGNILLIGYSETTQERIVQKIIIHRWFDEDTLENDITLLQLERPFIANSGIQVARLPMGRAVTGTFCSVAGWGFLDENNETVSDSQMFISIPLIHTQLCRKLYEHILPISNGMICAGYMTGGKDTCKGDSGGGMVCKNILTAIVCGGKGCANPRRPGIYTDIYSYKHWIESEIYFAYYGYYFNSANIYFVNIFWLIASVFSAFLLSMYC